MIQSIADKYRKHIAYPLFFILYFQTILVPLHAAIRGYNVLPSRINAKIFSEGAREEITPADKHSTKNSSNVFNSKFQKVLQAHSPEKVLIGGPGSPEASSFKAAGADNLVNLFTGDFSYSIPLLDVGGYPVNLFYSGGITMEQEASWVGLGWNINPGTVNRNMRGIPDDFNGEDMLTQTQNVKPNRTMGGEIGVDGELLGMDKPSVNLSLGVSVNNYLGPALELGAGISVGLPLGQSLVSEKGVGSNALGASLNAKLSSRSGLSFSPSLNLNLPLADKKANLGIGLSTSYNSRTGIKELNINSQMSAYRELEKSNSDGSPKTSSMHGSIGSSSISFARPTYIPTLRMPMENSNYSGQIEFGPGMFGVKAGPQMQGYISESKIPKEWMVIQKPLLGFIYSEKGSSNKNAVMDFNRVNDAEVTPNTPVVSAPQYAYDIFSIQGEGTGGTIRAYRGDLGFMRDNETTSRDKNISIGFDISPPGHFGGNWNVIKSPTRAGGWEDGNNTLRQNLTFQPKVLNTTFENIYFRNPGEVTVNNPQLINRTGGDNLVRFKLSGSDVNPRLETTLEQFNKTTIAAKVDLPITATNAERDKRTQVTTMLTASEASETGLEKEIRDYSGGFDSTNNIQFTAISRTEEFRKPHHISEINVLEQSGMRYVYGIPVYNTTQKDFTFSVTNTADPATGVVNFSPEEPTVGSPHMESNSRIDGYMMAQETPAYASSFLLTGLLSPDYVDVKNDGITEDDIGGAVKFDYNRSENLHRWRTPRGSQSNSAHFNEGLKSEKKDNKATISYGEREVWYLQSIESKSMVAIFKTEERNDAKGVSGELDGRINPAENANKRLKQIDLYTKAEIKAKGIANARPIKTVHFEYNYTLCMGTPDNIDADSGKLSLKAVYFTYNGQPRFSKSKYVFNYGNVSSPSDNPSYANNASDKWGTYKSTDINIGTNPAANPSGLYNNEFPYTSKNKIKNDVFAGAWSLKKILLPSGGQMEVEYEADDYGYVQNRRACDMFSIYGFGSSKTASTDNGLYQLNLSREDNNYVYVKLPNALQGTTTLLQNKEIFDKYLQHLNQLAFKLLINMPKGPEALTVYANFDDWGLCENNAGKDIIYLHLKAENGKSPLSKSTIGFITENLPGQAFPGYEFEADGLKGFLAMVGSMLGSLKNAFKNVEEQMRSAAKARTVVLDKSFIRLANPALVKYGGGTRVKRVLVKDNWDKMKGSFVSTYGQDYDYTTTEKINGTEMIISSGVASYEPGIGSEENPFREILSFSNKMPLASAQYGAIEMPMLEGLYPSPVVGYSKVTVRSIHRKGTHNDSTLRSSIGKQVTEFYTAKEFPTYSAYTPISQKEYHFNSFFNIFYKQINDRKVLSQGFLVETNDMHGKMKSQMAFSESDEKTPLSYSYHTYKNTGKNGFNDVVDFVNNEQGGTVTAGNMGIDMELMTDVREFKVETNGFNGQIQSDFFWFVPPVFVVPFIPVNTYTENKYRAVTTTKLINYHAIEDSVIVMDKGSVISTKTVAFDSETGAAIVTKTANEFNDPVYNVNYPAYWAYSGMGPAYKNVDRQFSNVNFIDGKLQGNNINQNTTFESGDELYITAAGNGNAGSCITESSPVTKLWAYDKNKNETALTVINKDFIFIDHGGNPYTKGGVSFRIIRSGKRNLLTHSAATITSMANPIVAGKLTINGNSKTVSAGAVEFREKWQADNDLFNRYSLFNPAAGENLIVNGNFENDTTGFTSSYTYSSFAGFGNYFVGTNPSNWCSCSISHGDHTSGTGKMLMVDGATNPTGPNYRPVWSQTVTVLPNADYDFSAWVQNSGKSDEFYKPYAKLQFVVNGNIIGTNFNVDALPTHWKNWSLTWNSGNNTTAVIMIRDAEYTGGANNFEIDDLVFKLVPGCAPVETADCNGYFEKKINPYVKGLIGNFRDYRSFVFYGKRNEQSTDPNSTAIRTNGYLADFTPYWSFNAANNLVPDINSLKWVWNSQNMKYNSKGLQLENKDALNVYTSAQYGFNKTQPVAVAKNSRNHEMFGEGFEDYNYNESINGSVYNSCLKKHIDLTGIAGTSIINTDSVTFRAHSGKMVLQSNANLSASLIIPVKSIIDSFNIVQVYNNLGQWIGGTPGAKFYRYCEPALKDSLIGSSSTNTWMNKTYPYGYAPGLEPCAQLTNHTVQIMRFYYKAPYTGTFNFSSGIAENSGSYKVYIRNPENSGSPNFSTSEIESTPFQSQYEFSDSYMGNDWLLYCYNWATIYNQPISINLCKDKMYEIIVKYTMGKGMFTRTTASTNGTQDPNPYCYGPALFYPPEKFLNSGITGLVGPNGLAATIYADKQQVADNCNFTNYFPAKDSLMNNTFTLIPGKKMLFSSWVREDCSSPCTKVNYTQNKVVLDFGSGQTVTLLPGGTIIEGWQKVEGEFTVPANATSMNIRFENNGASASYWDDIRIHPFNANMKTYTYDPGTLRLAAELDENNYATFYEYDEEGQLVRVKKETSQGIKTINETRSAKQKAITDLQ